MANPEKTLEMNSEEIASRLADALAQREKAEKLLPYLDMWSVCYPDDEKYFGYLTWLEDKIDRFLDDPDQEEFENQACRLILRGYVYGSKFPDGSCVNTSPVVKITRIGYHVVDVPGWGLPASGETFRATTRSGRFCLGFGRSTQLSPEASLQTLIPGFESGIFIG